MPRSCPNIEYKVLSWCAPLMQEISEEAEVVQGLNNSHGLARYLTTTLLGTRNTCNAFLSPWSHIQFPQESCTRDPLRCISSCSCCDLPIKVLPVIQVRTPVELFKIQYLSFTPVQTILGRWMKIDPTVEARFANPAMVTTSQYLSVTVLLQGLCIT